MARDTRWLGWEKWEKLMEREGEAYGEGREKRAEMEHWAYQHERQERKRNSRRGMARE